MMIEGETNSDCEFNNIIRLRVESNEWLDCWLNVSELWSSSNQFKYFHLATLFELYYFYSLIVFKI